MNVRIALSLLVLTVPAFVACKSPAPKPPTPADGEAPARPGEYLVRFQQAPDQQTQDSVKAETSATLFRVFDLLPELYYVRSPLSLDQMKQALSAFPVQSVNANHLLYGSSAEPSASVPQDQLPNDERFSTQWGLRNVAQTISPGILGTSGADIRAVKGWSVAKSTSVVIAVLDTGINLQHEDLSSNLWVNEKEAGGLPDYDDDHNGRKDDVNGWNFVSDTPDVQDHFGHGTEVASILGAVGGNRKGMTGVAWECKIMPLRIFDMGMRGLTTDEARAIDALTYAVKNGAKVSSNSWGAYRCGDPCAFDDLSYAIQSMGRRGHLFVTSSGNRRSLGTDNDVSPFVPGSFPLDNIVAVTSIGFRDELPKNANYGPSSVDLAAPGIEILTAAQSMDDGYSYVSGGTSYATPHVAAAAALLWDLPDWRTKDPGDVRQHLITTARRVPSMTGKTVSGGVLDLGMLLGSQRPPVPIEASHPN